MQARRGFFVSHQAYTSIPERRGLPWNDFLTHHQIPRSGLPSYALVLRRPAPGGSHRGLFEGAREIGNNREYVTYTGTRWHGGRPGRFRRTASGGPGAICMFEELAQTGVKTIHSRVGTCGGLVEAIRRRRPGHRHGGRAAKTACRPARAGAVPLVQHARVVLASRGPRQGHRASLAPGDHL